MTDIRHWLLFISSAFYLLLTGSVTAGGWLGVTIELPHGVQVAEIFKESPADRGNLKKGDIIHHVDGIAIRSTDHFIETITNTPAGRKTTLSILRKGKPLEITVTLENDAEHQSIGQGLTGRRLQSVPRSLMPHPSGPFFGGNDELGVPSQLFPSEKWASYRPPQERRYRPPAPSAWLGIAPGTATNGVAVMGVAPNSPAEQAALKVGDIVTAINRRSIASPEALVRTIGVMQPGDLVEISFRRDGRTHMLQVQLQKPPLKP